MASTKTPLATIVNNGDGTAQVTFVTTNSLGAYSADVAKEYYNLKGWEINDGQYSFNQQVTVTAERGWVSYNGRY